MILLSIFMMVFITFLVINIFFFVTPLSKYWTIQICEFFSFSFVDLCMYIS